MELFREVIAYNSITEGASGTVLAGVNRYTGNPIAAKVMNFGERHELKKMITELEIAFGFSDKNR